MTTITIPPDLEQRLVAEAHRRGTTAELLAVESLRSLFVPPPAVEAASRRQTLFDALDGFIGAIDGPSEPLSEEGGRRFTDHLAEKQRQGRL